MTAPESLPTLSTAELQHGLDTALGQLRFIRESTTLPLLDGMNDADWFAMPAGPTNLAWQVAHLAVSLYGLCLFRIRGRAEADIDLMPSAFRKAYGRGSLPSADPAKNASIDVIRATFEAVYQQSLAELATIDPSSLAEPVDRPWAVYPNRLGCLLMAPIHEGIHAGQIGMIRRALGHEPLR